MPKEENGVFVEEAVLKLDHQHHKIVELRELLEDEDNSESKQEKLLLLGQISILGGFALWALDDFTADTNVGVGRPGDNGITRAAYRAELAAQERRAKQIGRAAAMRESFAKEPAVKK